MAVAVELCDRCSVRATVVIICEDWVSPLYFCAYHVRKSWDALPDEVEVCVLDESIFFPQFAKCLEASGAL